MEYVYATLTLSETGAEINERNLTAVLDAAGADIVESRVKALIAALETVDIEALGEQAGHAPTPGTPTDEPTSGESDGAFDDLQLTGDSDAATTEVDADEEEDR